MDPDSIPGLTAASSIPGETSAWRKQLSKLAHEALADTARRRLAVNAKDGTILIRIPAGEFEMGDGKKNHKVELSEYWIGVYCVSNRQYGRFVVETRHRVPDQTDSTYDTPIWQNGQCPADKLDHSVVCVSWDDCAAYAKWAELNLPSEAQWEKAARGQQGLIYPWGDEWDESNCRNSTNKGSGQTAVVWEYPNGTSGYGTLQQAGNVLEWCADWNDESNYGKSPVKDPAGPNSGVTRVYRGGSWINGQAPLFQGAYRYGYVPAYRDGYLGFRLVRNRPIFAGAKKGIP